MQGSFLPTTLNEWLGVSVTIVGIVSASWALALRTIRGPLEQKFKEQGERIGKMEANCERHGAQIAAHDRLTETLHIQVTGMFEHHGKLSTQFEELLRSLEQRKDERHRDHVEVMQRLTAMETKIEMIGEFKEALVSLSRRLS